QKAIHKWENMSQSSSFRLAYEAREKVLFDEQAKLAHAREVGIEEGMEKGKQVGKEEGLQEGIAKGMEKGKEVGIQEGKIQLIQGMHKNGMDIEDIAKFTSMDLSDIRHILGQ
ncbi:Signal transduction histidine kinase, partial [Bacillus cereus]|nr:Signal transduction histidine kinase [Bacillus cereus]